MPAQGIYTKLQSNEVINGDGEERDVGVLNGDRLSVVINTKPLPKAVIP